jgi:uncharacterized protein YjbI with pentapeptide repeats
MKTIKPQKLGLLTRPFEYQRRYYLGVSVFAFIPLGNEKVLLSEVEMWKFAAAQLGKDTALDAGIPKAKCEFLLTGSAHIPSGEAKQACPVKVSLGALEKELHVFGDRYWKGGFPSDPAPFTSMSLDWAHAYGGEGFDHNPLGKGFAPVTKNDVALQWLPNIVSPAVTITSPNQRSEPAGYGPIDITWPQRFSKAGTHDDKWLKEDFPGFARDIDWTIFNLAPADQWFDQALKGDEPYRIVNMHPEKPNIEGRLPGIAGRCYIDKGTDQGEGFQEVPLRLATVWFFPHAQRAILIFQGLIEVQDENGADISHIVIGCEDLEGPKGIEHYRDVLSRRLDKEKGHLYALADSDLLPGNLSAAIPDAVKPLTASDGLMKKNLRRRIEKEIEQSRALVAGFGLDPDIHAPPLPGPVEEPPSDLDTLPAYIDRLKAEAENQKKADEINALERQKQLEKLFADLGLDMQFLKDELAQTPKGPPVLPGDQEHKTLSELMDRFKAQGLPTEEMESLLNDPERQKLLAFADAKTAESYKLTAHHQTPALRMPSDHADPVREFIMEAHAKAQSLAGRDFTGADLSGLDLRGVDLEGTYLESSNLDSVNLEGANLKNAVLAHSSLQGALLSRAVLTGANLGSAQLAGAVAHDADFSQAVLAKADLTGADFNRSNLQGTDLSNAVFKDTDFSGVKALQMLFLESDLKELKLTGACLKKCSFLKVDMSGTDFSGSDLESAVFLSARGKGALFKGASMTNVRFVQQCDFESADFTGTLLDNANLRGSVLNGCDFTNARLDGADLSECALRNARLYRVTAREARFIKADLNGAVLTSINAMNASFQRSDIRGADFRGANLIQADLARVHADPLTKLDDSLSTKVRIYPRRVS